MLPGLTSAILAAGRGTIQFVGGNTFTTVGVSSGSSGTIALNSGLTGGIASAVAAGDLVIAAFAVGSITDVTLSITDGTNPYTLIGSQLYRDGTHDVNLRVAYKFMGSTPDTATTFGPTTDSDFAGAGAVYVFRGVSQDSPLDVAAVTATGQAARPNPPSITPVTPGAFIVCVGAGGHNDGVDTFSTSDLADFLTAGGNDVEDATIGIGHKDDWISGAFDAAQFTFSGATTTSDTWAAMSIALRPA